MKEKKNIKIDNWRQAFKGPYTYDVEGQTIVHNAGGMLLNVRGWGHLTGIGALNLEDAVAVKLQDQMGRDVTDLLNKSDKTEKDNEEFICKFLEWIADKYTPSDIPEFLKNAPKALLLKYKASHG